MHIFRSTNCKTLFVPTTASTDLQRLGDTTDPPLTAEYEKDLADLRSHIIKTLMVLNNEY